MAWNSRKASQEATSHSGLQCGLNKGGLFHLPPALPPPLRAVAVLGHTGTSGPRSLRELLREVAFHKGLGLLRTQILALSPCQSTMAGLAMRDTGMALAP